jgi:hypothetical protein
MWLSGFGEYCPSRRVADRVGLSSPPPGVSSRVVTPAGGKATFVATPVGGKQPRCCPRRGLASFVGQVPRQGGVADPEVLGYARAV